MWRMKSSEGDVDSMEYPDILLFMTREYFKNIRTISNNNEMSATATPFHHPASQKTLELMAQIPSHPTSSSPEKQTSSDDAKVLRPRRKPSQRPENSQALASNSASSIGVGDNPHSRVAAAESAPDRTEAATKPFEAASNESQTSGVAGISPSGQTISDSRSLPDSLDLLKARVFSSAQACGWAFGQSFLTGTVAWNVQASVIMRESPGKNMELCKMGFFTNVADPTNENQQENKLAHDFSFALVLNGHYLEMRQKYREKGKTIQHGQFFERGTTFSQSFGFVWVPSHKVAMVYDVNGLRLLFQEKLHLQDFEGENIRPFLKLGDAALDNQAIVTLEVFQSKDVQDAFKNVAEEDLEKLDEMKENKSKY